MCDLSCSGSFRASAARVYARVYRVVNTKGVLIPDAARAQSASVDVVVS